MKKGLRPSSPAVSFHQLEADFKADGVTEWKDPESLSHDMEESFPSTRNTVTSLLHEQEIDFYFIKLLKYRAYITVDLP